MFFLCSHNKIYRAESRINMSNIIACTKKILWGRGGGGLVVGLFACLSDDPNWNQVEAYNFYAKGCLK